MTSDIDGSILPVVMRRIEGLDGWKQYQDKLLLVPDQEEMPTPDLRTREERLQQFIASHATTVAAVRNAAKVAKPNMQQWRRGDLSESSVMSERIEKVLSGKIPL
jgi:hypothetical protein